MNFALRPYQKAACEAAIESLRNHRSALIVAPTGTGKTITFAELARIWAKRSEKVLVLAHREELIDQAVDKITKSTGLDVEVEMGDHHANWDGTKAVLVASVQTMARAGRRQKYAPDAFGLIIVDEAHHAPASTYQDVLSYFKGAKVVGVTATPDRLDGRGMKEAFESVASVYEIRDAIEQRWLVPIRQRTVFVDSLNLDKVSVTKTGDFNEAELEAELMRLENLHRMAVPTVEFAGERPAIVFTASVAHAHALADVICNYKPGAARAVSGDMSREERREVLEDFRMGRIQFLINCALLTEGFDAPFASCVVIARPTRSRALYAQMVGRGTRILGASYEQSIENGKKDLLVVDLVGQAEQHSLVNCTDILDGNKDAELKAVAMDILDKDPDKDVLSALDEAAGNLAQNQKIRLLAKATYEIRKVDPFTVLGVLNRKGRWGGIGPTSRQVNALYKFGVPGAERLDRGQASALLDELFRRADAGRCTYRQAKLLMKHGLNCDVTFADANEAISAIASNGWLVPVGLMTDPRFRVASKNAA